MAFCAKCGNQMNEAASFCGKCGTSRPGPLPQMVVVVNQKSPGLAAILSLVWCGVGQVYNGQVLKGLAMMAGYPALLWFGLSLLFGGGLVAAGAQNSGDTTAGGVMVFLGLVLALSAFGLWLFGIINAYRTADRSNRAAIGGSPAIS